MLICPKCKLLYEKSNHCIRCGSSLVEKTSSEKEEVIAPPPSETNKEIPAIQETKDRKEESSSIPLFDFEEKFPPTPKPKAKKVKKEEDEIETIPDIKKPLHGPLTDEQSTSEIFPKEIRRDVSRSEKIQIRIPNLSYRNISIIVLILIGGYLLWSIYSHFSPKKPGTNAPPSKEAIRPIPSRPTTATKPVSPPIEPKIAHPPSPPSTPVTLKTPVSDGKEIENIKSLFENIRQANLRKDIDLFMSCYSAGFKDREGKKRETLKNWSNFTYINLSYALKEHSISGDTAGVKIAWVILFSSKAGGPAQESKTLLHVSLSRESDGWKINTIKPIS